MEKFDMAKFLADSGVGVNAEHREQIEYIRLDLIDGDPNNFYQLSGIEDLAANISLCGLQQPVRVREKPEGRYVVVSGHRRRAALELLAQDDPEHWQEVPCIVERDSVSPALQQLRLIYANANTRAMTSAELGEQAAQVEKLLYQLKDEGYEFPGRMRDHVAQAVNASKSKLARLKVIRENLAPQFMRMWKEDRLNESVAYTLAGQSQARQRQIFLTQTENYTKPFKCTDGWVDNIARQMDNIERVCGKTKCAVNHTSTCDHMNVRLDRAAGLGQYQGLSCRGCCLECFYLADCKFSCEWAADSKKVLRDKRRAERSGEKAAQLAKEQSERDLLALTYSRVGKLRKERNISAEEFIIASCGWRNLGALEKLPKLEDGSSVSPNDRLPGLIWAQDAMRLMETADLLGCSIDYMLGHDAPDNVSIMDTTPHDENVSNSDTWHTGEPPEPGEYVVFYAESFAAGIETESQTDEWTGTKWKYISPSASVKVVAWAYLPTVSQPPLNNSCITGMSPSGHCGAAACCNSDADCCLQCDQDCNGRCGWTEEEENNAKMQ